MPTLFRRSAAFGATLLLAAFLLVPAALAASPTANPTLAGSVTNSSPPPAPATRILDAAGIYSDAQKTDLANRLAQIWSSENIDVIIGARVAPDRNTIDETQTDAMNIGNNAKVGTGARGGLVLLFNLDTSKCHGQAQLYADDRLRVILPNADRQAIFDDLMKPQLKDCKLYDATTVALNAAISLIRGDRSVLPAPFAPDWGLIAVLIIAGLFGLFILIVILGRFAAFPGARARYNQMTAAYNSGKADPNTPSDNDEDFIYGAGHKHRRNPLDHLRNHLGNPNWSDPTDYPIYYGRPPGFWFWWFGMGSHQSQRINLPTTGGGSWTGGAKSSGGSWGSSGSSGGGSWGSAGLAAGGFWSGIGQDLGSVASGVGQGVVAVLDGLASGSGGSGGGFSGGGGAGGGF